MKFLKLKKALIFQKILYLVFFWLFAVTSTVAQNDSIATSYKLNSGDRISIHVFGEDDLTLETTVSDLGTISYPFLGEIAVKGHTVSELLDKIVGGLKGPYLVDPKVNIAIVQYRQFYIHGEVKKSGGYPYQPGLTLRKAISLAGGFTERASRTKIFVIREHSRSEQSVLIGMDDTVYPGDTITVEQSFF